MEAERRREVYKECMRNHAANLGTYSADGCCEYTPDATLNCAACGCHRNFHRKAFVDHSATADSAAEERTEGGSRRRTRTRFTKEQKASMASFAESIGWRMPKRDGDRKGDEVARFCREIGVGRQVFKVWMHNHKSSSSCSAAAAVPNSSSTTQTDAEIDEEVKDASM